jgi:hypothetical protein
MKDEGGGMKEEGFLWIVTARGDGCAPFFLGGISNMAGESPFVSSRARTWPCYESKRLLSAPWSAAFWR